MTTDNGVDETGIYKDLPPSYQNLLRQQSNASDSNLFLINSSPVTHNRPEINCSLCQCCHNQAKQNIKLLTRLCHTLECYDINVQSHSGVRLIVIILFFTAYFLYLWGSAVNNGYEPTVNNEMEKIFADLNISEDIQQIIVDNSKRNFVRNFKQCISSYF